MNTDTSTYVLPDLTASLLKQNSVHVDNLFSALWSQLGMSARLARLGFVKRTGTPASELVYLLLIWVWLKMDSIAMFARESLLSFSSARKDAMYDLLNREDLDWRKLHLQTAKAVLAKTTARNPVRAFVVDDTVKVRRGTRMPGISSHFDHLSGRCVMGQQVLTLGLATPDQFIPLDSEIFISASLAQGLTTPFVDGRSIAARRYRLARDQGKPQMLEDMLGRVVRAGIEADYFLADAWFATRRVLALTEHHNLTAVVRMKKSGMKFQMTTPGQQTELLNATQLYQQHIRKQWKKLKDRPYQVQPLVVQMRGEPSGTQEGQWVRVKLLFVRGVNRDKPQPGKHDWALFLSSDPDMNDQAILDVYALRWGIEVYFKEAKQYLGFLKEQSRHYSAYMASLHLTAIRFCMLLMIRSRNAGSLGASRCALTEHLQTLDYSSRLWVLFRAIIHGAVDQLRNEYGQAVDKILDHIDRGVKEFFVQVMQLDTLTLRLESDIEPANP